MSGRGHPYRPSTPFSPQDNDSSDSELNVATPPRPAPRHVISRGPVSISRSFLPRGGSPQGGLGTWSVPPTGASSLYISVDIVRIVRASPRPLRPPRPLTPPRSGRPRREAARDVSYVPPVESDLSLSESTDRPVPRLAPAFQGRQQRRATVTPPAMTVTSPRGSGPIPTVGEDGAPPSTSGVSPPLCDLLSLPPELGRSRSPSPLPDPGRTLLRRPVVPGPPPRRVPARGGGPTMTTKRTKVWPKLGLRRRRRR